MATTTAVVSVSLPVADQDRALRFYTEVLGFELRMDIEAWPGARVVEVAPPGSAVGILLLPPDSEVPVAVRLSTPDAAEAHRDAVAAGLQVHNPEVLELEGMPPMFSFADPDGNGLVFLQQEPPAQG